MLIAFAGGLGLPASVSSPGRRRRPGSIFYAERDALALLASRLAPASLRRAVVPAPAYEPPPIILKRAAVADELVYVDYSHLYARIAARLLDAHGYAEGAAWFSSLIRRRETLPAGIAERYVVFSQPTDFADYAVLPGVSCRSGAARRWYRERTGEPPLTEEELLEELARAPCAAFAVKVKSVVKYLPHVVVGLSRRWGTGLWEAVVNESWRAARRLMRVIEERGGTVYAYLVDAVIADTEPRYALLDYPARLKARGDGLVAGPWTFRVGDEYGYWGVYDEPPVDRAPVIAAGRPIIKRPRYIGARQALRCEKPVTGERLQRLKTLLERYGVTVVDGRLCSVADARLGEERIIKRLPPGPGGIGAAMPA